MNRPETNRATKYSGFIANWGVELAISRPHLTQAIDNKIGPDRMIYRGVLLAFMAVKNTACMCRLALKGTADVSAWLGKTHTSNIAQKNTLILDQARGRSIVENSATTTIVAASRAAYGQDVSKLPNVSQYCCRLPA